MTRALAVIGALLALAGVAVWRWLAETDEARDYPEERRMEDMP